MKKYITAKNLHLMASAMGIILIGLAYGLHPAIVLQKIFNFKMANVNMSNIFRATMGLYLSMTALWIAGIVKPKLWATATIANILFMGGLAADRLLSLALDGIPSLFFVTGLIIEIALATWGVINLKKYGKEL